MNKGSMDWRDIYNSLRYDLNDAAAWAALERRVGALARAALRQRGPHVVSDAIQDTCAAVAVNFDRAYGPDTFAGFVYGQFLMVRRQLLRGTALDTTSLDGVEIPAPEDDYDAGPTAKELALLHAALHELPTRQRRALLLRYMEQSSAAQIAVELDTTPGNARRLVCLGLQQLRRLVREGMQASVHTSTSAPLSRLRA